MTNSGQWHLDKRIPVALVFALLVQTAAGVWFAAKIDARVQFLEQTMNARADTRDRIVRVETQMISIRDLLARIDRKLEKISGG